MPAPRYQRGGEGPKKRKQKTKLGRPCTFTEEKAARICEIIGSNSASLLKLCKEFKEMPDESTIYNWAYHFDQFSRDLNKAFAKQAHLRANMLEDVIDDVKVFTDENGQEKVDSGVVALNRLRVESRKWVASKKLPSEWGDAKALEDMSKENEAIKKELAQLREELAEKSQKEY